MTLIVGIRCEDGVVMASDSAATFGTGGAPTIGQQNVTKIVPMSNAMLYSGTGSVGMSQVISDIIKKVHAGSGVGSGKTSAEVMRIIGTEITKAVGPFIQTARMVGDGSTSYCKSMLAMVVGSKPCLFTFDGNGAPEEATEDLPFVAMGSGQAIADPFLAYLKRLFWLDSAPTLAEGRLVATWVLEHATRTNAGGIGGPTQLADLTCVKHKPRIEVYDADRIQEHLQNVHSAEDALVRAIRNEDGDAAAPPTFKEKKATG
jgi:20S proteasome alpha/beta subunit